MSKLTKMFAARVNAKARLRIVNTLALRFLGKLLFYPLFALLCIFLPTSRSLPPFFFSLRGLARFALHFGFKKKPVLILLAVSRISNSIEFIPRKIAKIKIHKSIRALGN